MTSPSSVLVISTWIPDDIADEFSAWCDVHHRGLLSVPGVRRARRFTVRSSSGSGGPGVLVTYELDDPSIPATDLWRQRGMAHGPLPPQIAERLRTTRRSMSIVAALPDVWWPPRRSTLLDVFSITDDRRVDDLVRGIGAMASTDPGPVTVRVLRDDEAPTIVLIDHDADDGRDVIDDLTDSSGANRSRWSVVFDEMAESAESPNEGPPAGP